MPLPAEIRPKLAKLFPMLSSDKAPPPGTLQAAGADWHDLAEDFECAAEPLIVYRDALGRDEASARYSPPVRTLPRSARLDWLRLAVASPLLSGQPSLPGACGHGSIRSRTVGCRPSSMRR